MNSPSGGQTAHIQEGELLVDLFGGGNNEAGYLKWGCCYEQVDARMVMCEQGSEGSEQVSLKMSGRENGKCKGPEAGMDFEDPQGDQSPGWNG